MKLTKTQLQEMIREELLKESNNKHVSTINGNHQGMGDTTISHFYKTVNGVDMNIINIRGEFYLPIHIDEKRSKAFLTEFQNTITTTLKKLLDKYKD
jgi:hypothetical protein